MKKITLLFITMLALSFATYGQCNYSIELKDSFGDGWEDTTVDVLVNGGVVLDDISLPDTFGTPSPGGDSAIYMFSVSDSDVVTVFTTIGPAENFPAEISYVVSDALGGLEGIGVWQDDPNSSDPKVGTFNDTSAINASCPPCDVPIVSYSVLSNCPVDNDFTINVNVSDIGSASGIIITDDQGTPASAVLGVGTHNYGSYTNGTAVVITVTNADNGICTINSNSLTFDTSCPPANDDACNAVAITMNTESSGAIYDNTGATVETSEPTGSCWFGNATSESVWFTFVAPASGEVRILTKVTGATGTLTDTQIALYSGIDCNDLSTFTELACDDDDDNDVLGSGGLLSVIENTTLTGGNTYYVQVNGYNANIGTFDLGVYDLTTLSTETFEVVNRSAVSYFPNPVTNKLTLKAQQNIQNVSVFNMLGQEVMRTELNVQRGDLDMSSLQSGPYFVKVSINDKVETLKIIKK